MKMYIHARLSEEDRAVLEELKELTGRSESELVRHGLRLVRDELERKQSALRLAGRSVGKFKGGPKDLSRNKKHLDEFGR
jgi:Arc/MetJ-type ribon-helix-helix transcriptional regulator